MILDKQVNFFKWEQNYIIYKDGLHVIGKGKAFLADNFIVYLNSNIF